MSLFDEPRNVFEVVFPFYCVLKAFGYIPFSFKGPIQDGNMVTTIPDVVYFAFSLVFHIVMFFILLQKDFISFMGSEVMEGGSKSAVVLSALTIIVSVFYQFLKRKNIQKFLKEIHEIDQEVRL